MHPRHDSGSEYVLYGDASVPEGCETQQMNAIEIQHEHHELRDEIHAAALPPRGSPSHAIVISVE